MLQPISERTSTTPPDNNAELVALLPENAKWRVESKGSCYHIVRPDGSKASEDYHEFIGLVPTEGVLPKIVLLGKRGSSSHILCYNQSEQKFEPKGHFHELKCRSEIDAFVCSKGSLEYIVNPFTAEPLSKEYHSITRDPDGRYWGEIGAIKEQIELPTKDKLSAREIPLTEALKLYMNATQQNTASASLIEKQSSKHLTPTNSHPSILSSSSFKNFSLPTQEYLEIFRGKIRGAEITIRRGPFEDLVTVFSGDKIYFHSNVSAMSLKEFTNNRLQELSNRGVRAKGRQILGVINDGILSVSSRITPFSIPRSFDDCLRYLGTITLAMFQSQIVPDGYQVQKIRFSGLRCNAVCHGDNKEWKDLPTI